MQITGRIAVVTGAASGIGRALAQALAEAGAAKVICADLDGAGAEAVARAIGGRAFELDVSNEKAVAAMIREVEDQDGPIDLFCANAGILTLGGLEADNAAWQRTWEVNVMSQLFAARHMVPRMAARGGGYLLFTASAAGLLSQVGAAPYAVTKHASVALAEWVAFSHHDAGIRVSVLCPQAVESAMTRGFEDSVAAIDGMLPAEQVAADCLEAIAAERFLVLPHPQVAEYRRIRATEPERWLAGMRKLHRRFGGDGRRRSGQAPRGPGSGSR